MDQTELQPQKHTKKKILLNHNYDTTCWKNASSMNNIIVFTLENHPTNREIRSTL